eukprot:superscaffoldBa00002463_g14323
MGAESSVQRDVKSQEDASASASAGELSAEVKVLQEGGSVLDSKRNFSNASLSTTTTSDPPSSYLTVSNNLRSVIKIIR